MALSQLIDAQLTKREQRATMSNNSSEIEKIYDLEDLERCVYRRDYENAMLILLRALQGFEQKTWDLVTVNQSVAVRNRNKSASKILLTRFCAAVTALLSDPQLTLSRSGFEYLLLFKRYLDTVFAATDFSDMSHILALIGEKSGTDTIVYKNDSDFYKVIVACSANSGEEIIGSLLQSLPKDLGFLFWLSLLDNEMVLTEKSDNARNTILEHASRFVTIVPSDIAVIRLVNTWMFCSYMNNPQKHHIKIHLNKIVKNYCQKNGVKQPFIAQHRVTREKPVLLVIAERYTSDHAMYRCYGHAVDSLNKHFYTVFISVEKRFDRNSVKNFNQVITLDKSHTVKDIKSTIGKIIKLAPDVIYYPSVGMEAWVVACTQYRLAPIQLMTMGHPATSFCEHMDYIVAEEGTMGDPQCLFETAMHVKNGAFALSMGALQFEIFPNVNVNPDVLKIAIPSIAYKLNPSVLDVCKKILETSSRPVEFHFFPNMSGVNFAAIQTRLSEIMPCVVYENMHYKDYMRHLAGCDIALSPFPFGNTNGFIDCIRLAIPVICLDGPEAHSHTDYELSLRVGLPEFCRTTSVSDYYAAVMRLIRNNSERVEISNSLLEKNIDSLLFNHKESDVSEDFSQLCFWIYQHHEAIKHDNHKLWTVAQRQSFVPQSTSLKQAQIS